MMLQHCHATLATQALEQTQQPVKQVDLGLQQTLLAQLCHAQLILLSLTMLSATS